MEEISINRNHDSRSSRREVKSDVSIVVQPKATPPAAVFLPPPG